MIVRDDDRAVVIYLGRQGENNARTVLLDLSYMTGKYGAGTATLCHQRSQDVAPYVVGTGTAFIVWDVSTVDLNYAGEGQAEVRFAFDSGLVKSCIYKTLVKPSITGDIVIPDPLQSWYDGMLDYIADNYVSDDDLSEAVAEAVAEYIAEHPIEAPVTSVNGETGDVVINIPVTSVNGQTGAVTLVIPTKTSDLTNDAGFGTYSKPSGGIPKSDLASAVRTSLEKADTALQTAPVTSVNGKTGDVTLNASDVGAGTYSKPSGGIPKTDLASAVQTSLGKADTALQSAPVSSVDGKTGTVTVIPSGGTQGYVLKKASATDYDVEWAAESGGSTISPSDTSPVMDGTAAAGSSTAYARGDHVHPSDTTRQATADRVTTTPCTSEKNATTKYYSASAAWAWMNKIVPGYYSTGANQSGNGWRVGDYCNMGGKIYRCLTACNNEAFAANHWTEITDLSDDIVKQVLYQIAAEYDSTATYALGAYCIHQKALYRCTTAISTAEAWTAAHWTATTVSAELAAISVPSPSSSTPQPLGTAAAGSSTDYSRADHVHAKPTAADVGALSSSTTYVSTVNGSSGAVTLSIPSTAADVGAIPAPSSPSSGQFLSWNGSAWVAASLPTYNGGVS